MLYRLYDFLIIEMYITNLCIHVESYMERDLQISLSDFVYIYISIYILYGYMMIMMIYVYSV